MNIVRQMAPAQRLGTAGVIDSAADFTKIGLSLVIAASTFNLVLCFIQTRHWGTPGTSGVIVVELLILACGLFFIRHHLSRSAVQIAGVILLYLIGVKLINPGLDLKIYHDLAIMYIFFTIGTLTSIESGNRVLWICMIIVLAVGFFECLLPTQFGNVFDAWSYYVGKGTLGQDVVNYSQTNLFISGNRGSAGARTFLPGLLGAHRVSSVFLEPISMGNFATITFAWCLSTTSHKRWNNALLIFLGMVCIVLGDSRFGSACCMFMLALRFVPAARSRFVVFLMPVLVMLALMLAGSIQELPGVRPAIQQDDFYGRLLFSGRLLDYWHVSQWLGFAPSQVYTSDTGYAYFVNNLGLPLGLIVLAIFAATAPRRREAVIMKTMLAIYFATSLGVGSSVFSIKTGALLWFLYGATNSMRDGRPRPPPSAPPEISVSSIFPLSYEGKST
jgi:putative polymerase